MNVHLSVGNTTGQDTLPLADHQQYLMMGNISETRDLLSMPMKFGLAVAFSGDKLFVAAPSIREDTGDQEACDGLSADEGAAAVFAFSVSSTVNNQATVITSIRLMCNFCRFCRRTLVRRWFFQPLGRWSARCRMGSE